MFARVPGLRTLRCFERSPNDSVFDKRDLLVAVQGAGVGQQLNPHVVAVAVHVGLRPPASRERRPRCPGTKIQVSSDGVLSGAADPRRSRFIFGR